MFGGKTKKLQERAIRLVARAQALRDSMNSADDFGAFMRDYEKLLSCFNELSQIQSKIRLVGITGDPSKDYIMLTSEASRYVCAALRRNYGSIIDGDCSGNARTEEEARFRYEKFLRDIEEYRCWLDEDASRLADSLIARLHAFLYIDPDVFCASSSMNSFPADGMDGHDFEYWCANLLRGNGFYDVRVTGKSGDQGVDIIAAKDGIRYAIQCKCYSDNLGNTPIQEVNAGKTYYHCHVGAVMTNRHFTKAAKELACSTGTLLWDREKLREMLGTLSSDSESSLASQVVPIAHRIDSR